MSDLARDIDALAADLVAWRRDFHRHPELAFEEHRTSKVVRAFLESLGLDVRPCAGTGLRAVLRGGTAGPAIALRADMDALRVNEENDLEYRSQAPGVMHACGHDGHMAILMGTAKVLAARRSRLRGTVIFLFQPSEERHPGGAVRMIEDGALDGVDCVFGLHLWQPLASGLVGVRPGPIMAQSDTIRVIVNGRGGHASQPNLTVDPVVVASHLVVAAQTVVSRSVDPRQAAVVSFTTVHGGSAHNIVPDQVTLTGTVRTLDADVQRDVKQRLLEVCEGTCRLFGASCAFEYDDGYPAVVNSPQMADLLAQVAADEFGAAQVSEVEPVMCGEDFAYYLRRVPGAFALLGIGNRPHPHHSARFDIDEAVLPLGVRLFARLVLE